MNRYFLRAALWFGFFAALLVIPIQVTFGGAYWLSAPRVKEAFWMAVHLIVIPIGSALVLGGLLGGEIARRADMNRLQILARGAAVGAGAGLLMYIGLEGDILMTDYSNAVETSAARARSLNAGVFSVVIPLVSIVGAFAASTLHSLSHYRRRK